ncbi:hypothetical protein [Leucobacter soli]
MRGGFRALGAAVLALLVALSATVLTNPTPSEATPNPIELQASQKIAERTGSIYSSGQHQAAIGRDGTSAVVWQEANGGGIYISVREPGRVKWGAPRQLSRFKMSNGKYRVTTAWAPTVAVGGEGTIAVAWQTYSGHFASVRPGGGKSWTEPHKIGTRNIAGVTVGPNGAVTAVGAIWNSANELQSHFRPAGAKTKWKAAKRISPKGVSAHEVQIALSGDGHLALAWTTQEPERKNNLYVSTTNGRSGAWTSAARLATGISSTLYTHAIGTGGRAVVAWLSETGTNGITARALTKAGAEWQAAKTISTTTPNAIRATITGSGTSLLAWHAYGAHAIQTSALSAAESSWSAVSDLVPANAYIEHDFTLAGGPGEDAMLAWTARGSQTLNPEVRVGVRGSSGWSAGHTPISENPATTWWNSNPLAVLGPNGEASVYWIRNHNKTESMNYTSQVLVRSTPVPAMTLLSAARVKGTPRVGSALTCPARWSHAATRKTTWHIGSKVVGRSASYTPKAANRGKKIRCTVVATNPQGTATSTSAWSKSIAKGVKLKVTKRPSITGTKKAGSTVRVSLGKWTPKATSYTVRWKMNGKAVGGNRGTAKSLKLKASDSGKKLSVTVTAKRAGHTPGKKTSKTVRISR